MSLTAGKQLLLSSPAGGYQVSRSLRFNSADSANLSKTFASAGNQTTWTLSCWFKLCRPGSDFRVTPLFSGSSPWGGISIYQDKIRFAAYNGAYIVHLHTTQVLRDPSAWYHLVAVFDSNNGTSGDRARLYLNGSRITAFSTETYPSSGATTTINSTGQQYIGYEESNAVYSDCYFADYWFLDGIATDASSFGKTDVTTGQWIPKTYTGAKSGNSFHLEFADNSAATATTLGKDTSGNGNNWTPNNFSVAPTNINTSQKWSGLLSASGGSGFANQGAGGFAGYDDTNNYTYVAGSSSGTNYTITLTPPSPISFTTSLVVRVESGLSQVTINGGTTWVNDTAGLVTFTGPGSFSAISVRDSRGQYSGEFHSVKVDGNLLVDPGALSYVDSLVDTPTSYGADTGAGGEVRGNYCTWSPLSNSGSAPTNGNLTLPSNGGVYVRCNSTQAVSSGKWYFEVTLTTVGLVTSVGVARDYITNKYPGEDANSYARGLEDGNVTTNNSSIGTAPTMTTGDVFCCALDLDNNKLWFGKNGIWTNPGGTTGNPASGTNPTFNISAGSYTPIARVYASGQIDANFGQRAFAYTAPSGFKALCDTNLSAPVIAKPNTLMDAKLYTGNGSTNNITGLNFSPDFVWIKRRDSAGNHALFDAVRGTGKFLESSTTGSETTSSNSLTAFNSDGFSLGTETQTNTNSATYVAWTWDANSSNTTNTAGSITSTVRANATAGFSIVSYNSGSSTGNFTLGHGLNVAPKFIIHKSRSTSNWWVYHASVVDDLKKYMQLNSTNAVATNSNNMWGGAFPTSSVFGVTVGDLIGTSQDAIAYVFSPVAGYSSISSWVGNGSSDGVFVWTGFRPRFLIWKNASGIANWYIYDSARSTYNVTNLNLEPNTSDAENTLTSMNVDFLSNGFKIRGSDGDINGNGSTYIYAAFAESPFQYARAK